MESRTKGKKILDLFFPPRCAVCDGVLAVGEQGICSSCEHRLPRVEEPRCFCCGKTVEGPEVELCRDCSKKKHEFRRGFPLLQYVPPISDAMAELKYHGRAEYADFYGEQLGRAFGETFRSLGIQGLVPVPVHKKRLAKRGYNQAELLAGALSRQTGIPLYTNVLLRREDTAAQKKLSREERALNLRTAFSVGDKPPERVLIVDDIYTTGATADACAAALLRAGAVEVYVTTVAC